MAQTAISPRHPKAQSNGALSFPKYDQYKDSGVAWLGDIPEGWEVYTNKNIFKERVSVGNDKLPILSVSIHSAVSDKEIDNIQGRIKIEDKSQYRLVKTGDIVFNMMRAWQGAIGDVKTEGMVSPAYIIAQPIKNINSQYFSLLFRTPIYISQMDKHSKGITDFRKRLYWDSFKQLNCLVPPLEEQQKIVSFLGEKTAQIDEAIEIKKKQIDLLKERKQIIIQNAVTKGLDPNVPMKDSGIDWIGDIPKHWDVKKIRNIVKLHSGNGFPVEMQGQEGTIPFVKVSDFSAHCQFLTSANNYVTERNTIQKNWNLVPKNSIVTAKIGEALRKNHRNILGCDAVIDNNCIGLEPKSINLLFFFYLHKIIDFDWFVNPGTVPSISVQKYKSCCIVSPPLIEQQEIVAHIEEQSTQTDKAIAQQKALIEKLKEYRASLINSAVTGKIKVL